MELDTAIEILKEMITLNSQILLPGERMSDFDVFVDNKNKAIERVLEELNGKSS